MKWGEWYKINKKHLYIYTFLYFNPLVSFFLVYSKFINIRSSFETCRRATKKQFFLKNKPELKIANFLITILQIFWDSVIQSLKNFGFDRNNLFTHFCFSELLILREKGSRILLGHWSTIKKLQIFKNIERTPYRRVAQKLQFCTRRRKSHLFLTQPVYRLSHSELVFLFQFYGALSIWEN